MVAAAGRLRGGSRPAPRGPLPNGAAGARSCESGPLPRPLRPRPRRAAQAREPRAPCGTHHPAGRRGGAPSSRLTAGAALRLRGGPRLRGHKHRTTRSADPEPVAAASSQGGPGDAQKRAPPPLARPEWAGPGKEGNAEAPPVNTRGRPGGARARGGGGGACRRPAEAMAARAGLGPQGSSRRRLLPDGTRGHSSVKLAISPLVFLLRVHGGEDSHPTALMCAPVPALSHEKTPHQNLPMLRL
ncbi:translation initiation factor IF-2-like isoform X2 [Felis catus]|uniref:translation initiation factor IF-2-like isoform X2 n=1 Tax=Felis catus TaxID=9685 RepID=UPI001D19A3A1|nr:translation initiation factor IF-2-like isoform X2 [Felis catus]